MPSKIDLSKNDKVLSFWNSKLNKVDLNTVSIQGDNLYDWKCFKGHNFSAKVKSIYYGKNPCPYCDNRVPIMGETDFKTLFPKAFSMLYGDEKYIKMAGELHIRSTKEVNFICSENHIFKKAINKIKNDNSVICSYCNGAKFDAKINSLSATNQNLLNDWDWDKNSVNPNKVSKNSSKRYYWKCTECTIERFYDCSESNKIWLFLLSQRHQCWIFFQKGSE